MTNGASATVPQALRTWFVVHFWADILSALPLFFAPHYTLGLLGWTVVDPIAIRLVAAALFGIGIESWIGRNGNAESFISMLNLKVIWSFAASVGVLWAMLEGAHDGAPAAWAVLGIFGVFHVIWVFWRWRLGTLMREAHVSAANNGGG